MNMAGYAQTTAYSWHYWQECKYTGRTVLYYLEKEAVSFGLILLSVSDHGAIKDIAVMVSYKIPTAVLFYCLKTCINNIVRQKNNEEIMMITRRVV